MSYINAFGEIQGVETNIMYIETNIMYISVETNSFGLRQTLCILVCCSVRNVFMVIYFTYTYTHTNIHTYNHGCSRCFPLTIE